MSSKESFAGAAETERIGAARILRTARLFRPRTCTAIFDFRCRKPAVLSNFHLPSNRSPAVRPWASVFAFPAKSLAPLWFLPLILFTLQPPILPSPGPQHFFRGVGGARFQVASVATPGALRDISVAVGFLGVTKAQDSVSDSCRPRRSTAPSSGHWGNCILRVVLGKLCY